jgi:hypothetical protein
MRASASLLGVWEVWHMNKRVLFGLLVLVFCPTLLFGQTITPGLFPTGYSKPTVGESGILSGIPTLAGLETEKIKLNPFVQIGYQRTGVNINIPLDTNIDPPEPFPHLRIGTVDVKLIDYNFWTGTVGLNAVVSPKVTLFGAATGFLPHDFLMVGKLPISIGPGAFDVEFEMTGSNFEFWTLQGGVSYGIGGGNSILLGFLWSRTAMVMTNPRTAAGPVANQTITQDFFLKNWGPFIGLQTMQPGFYRAALTYIPFLASRGTLRQTSITPMNSESWDLNQPGYLISVTGEYYLPSMSESRTFSVWAMGAASRLSGSSDFQFESALFSNARTVDNLTLTQYVLGVGVSFGLIF